MKHTITRSRRVPATNMEAGAWLQRLLLQVCSQAVTDVRRISLWPTDAVHALRKRMKKLQSLLRLVPPGPEPEALRSLRAAIGKLKATVAVRRDNDVLVELARDLGVHRRLTRNAPIDPAPILLQVRALMRQVRVLNLADLNWEQLDRRYQKTCRRAQQAWKAVQRQPKGELFHEWRKRVKDLHFQTLALHLWMRRPKQRRRTHQLGALLGQRCDLDLYQARLERAKQRPPRKLMAAVKVRQVQLTRRIFQRAEAVFERGPPRLYPPKPIQGSSRS